MVMFKPSCMSLATVSRSAAAPVHGVPEPLHGGPLALARFMRDHGMLNLNYARLIARWRTWLPSSMQPAAGSIDS